MPKNNQYQRKLLHTLLKGMVAELNEAAEEVRSVDDGMQGYFIDERKYFGRMFRTLAKKKGRLREDELRELADMATYDVRHAWQIVGSDNTVRVVEEVKFVSPAGEWAYAVLELAKAGPKDFRVIHCRQCEKLQIVEMGFGTGGGRPRSAFCSKKCSDSFNDAKARRKKARAAKHK